jgi:signal transduction histidine kinase
MWTRLRRRHFDSRPLVWQFVAVTLLPALLVAAGLHWGLRLPPELVGTMLATAALCAVVCGALAHRVSLSLRQIIAATQLVRRSEAVDDVNLPLQTGSAELQRASAGLRRLIEVWRRRQRELLAQTESLGRRLALRVHELSTLQDLSIGLASKTELHELVAEALTALEQTMAYTSASVWSRTARDEGGQVVLMGYKQNDDVGQAPDDDLTGMRLSRSNLQHYEHIEREGEAIVENHVRQSLLSWLWSWLSDDARTSGLYRGTKAWMAVPLKSRESVMGVLRVDHEEPDFFDAERVRLLTAVGSQTGLAMRHAQLLSQQKDQAVVAERNRIARDLHDAVSQTLFAANVIAGTLGRLAGRLVERDPNAIALQQQAEALERLNKGALSEMRLLMFELRPDALQHLPLADLLQHAIDALASRGTIEVSHRLARDDRLPSATRIQIYRIAQEALSNIGRHSGASHAVVEWLVPEQGVGGRLRIADDGHGFDPGVSRPGHFGLSNMAERAAEIGATWNITSGPDEGTEIRLELK